MAGDFLEGLAGAEEAERFADRIAQPGLGRERRGRGEGTLREDLARVGLKVGGSLRRKECRVQY